MASNLRSRRAIDANSNDTISQVSKSKSLDGASSGNAVNLPLNIPIRSPTNQAVSVEGDRLTELSYVINILI